MRISFLLKVNLGINGVWFYSIMILLTTVTLYGTNALSGVLALASTLQLGACPKLSHIALSFNWMGVIGSRALGKKDDET